MFKVVSVFVCFPKTVYFTCRRMILMQFTSITIATTTRIRNVTNTLKYRQTITSNLHICLACSFYAFFPPIDGNPRNVTLVSDDGKHVYQNGDNSELLGQASSYLKILGASCAGCCDLSAAFFVPSCSPPGVFVQ